MRSTSNVTSLTTQQTESQSGATYLADTIASMGCEHVFFVDAVLRETLIELEKRGIDRNLAHTEKSAVYMADGYARATGQLAFAMAQSVGAANLAAGLQDAYLDRVPLVTEKRARVGDALRGGITWRCSDAVNSLQRKGYATARDYHRHTA
ncbi:Acetolactate synthase large subunit [Marinovum algicola]|uniref:Thiamine pyrophosphate enzyme, N-terminal TPP binding domain n=1 Tax=Marinovum algicola TaxID=42444 RepID=A0A975ZR42_9RHOB|nr:thiamine pyrophosphate-binding protein [Marinovum algicola]SEK11135.1 Thiamine pyrophosphate enzyme, N-terminal TPP binding domain [Marinovum algicola]SLN71196.1 Acetolactate synthase large subunit [Marinovum algicola]